MSLRSASPDTFAVVDLIAGELLGTVESARGFTVKIEATGWTGRTRASAPPYSEPPVGDGAGVPPA